MPPRGPGRTVSDRAALPTSDLHGGSELLASGGRTRETSPATFDDVCQQSPAQARRAQRRIEARIRRFRRRPVRPPRRHRVHPTPARQSQVRGRRIPHRPDEAGRCPGPRDPPSPIKAGCRTVGALSETAPDSERIPGSGGPGRVCGRRNGHPCCKSTKAAVHLTAEKFCEIINSAHVLTFPGST
jgi:hypothetical protein